MACLCGLGALCGNVVPAAEDLTKQEVADLFSLSTRLNGGRLIVHGLFARTDVKNTNGRIYPKSIMKREVTQFKRQHIKQGTALGELNHPSYYSSYFRSLNLPNVSHQVLEVWWRGRELWGVIEVLPTPAGLLLWELYSKGIKLGVSSRGWASVVVDPSTQQMFVDKDFQLITFDFVTEPSNAGAFLVPIGRKYRRQLPDQSRVVRVSYLGIGSSHMTQLAQIPGATILSNWLKQTSKAMSLAQHLVTATPQKQHSQAGSMVGSPTASGSTLLQPPNTAVAVACSAHLNGDDTSIAAASQQLTLKRTVSGSSDAAAGSFLAALGSRSPSGTATLPPYISLGGGVILGCHYRVLDEPWLPVDPSGREFKMHLSLVATKAHLLQQKQERKLQQRVKRRQQQPTTAQEHVQQSEVAAVFDKEQQRNESAADPRDAAATGAAVVRQKSQSALTLDQHKPLLFNSPAAAQQGQQAGLLLPLDKQQQSPAEDGVHQQVQQQQQRQQQKQQQQQEQQQQQLEQQHYIRHMSPAGDTPATFGSKSPLQTELLEELLTSGAALNLGSSGEGDTSSGPPSLPHHHQHQQQQQHGRDLQEEEVLHQCGSTLEQASLQEQVPPVQVFRQKLSSRTRVAPLWDISAKQQLLPGGDQHEVNGHYAATSPALAGSSTAQQDAGTDSRMLEGLHSAVAQHEAGAVCGLQPQYSPEICPTQQHKHSASSSGSDCSTRIAAWYAENAYPGVVSNSHHEQHAAAVDAGVANQQVVVASLL